MFNEAITNDPTVFAIPVFIALYWVLLESVELRQANWFWLTDLSVQDPFYILPIIMGVSMILQQKLNPAPMDEINLKVINSLRTAFEVEVGYSDHTMGIEVPIAAVTLGATVIEKHFNNYIEFFFKYESIYDLVQGFYRIMHLNELENPYLHHLADFASFEAKLHVCSQVVHLHL